MKTICFTNNDLARTMGIEVGKTYKISGSMPLLIYEIIEDKKGTILTKDIDTGRINGVSVLLGRTLIPLEPKPKPKLTEQEITILKGRLAEGFIRVGRPDEYEVKWLIFENDDVEVGTTQQVDELFQFIKPDEEYSIEELLKGEQPCST